ncbi:MAG: asparaginase [Armatimonadetes bacterium]|nr:asparaginase [Armatimonadota bacterium]MDW8028728.1 asparaginase [Armatimonadota bacterium]
MEPLRVEFVRKNIVEATHFVHAIALDETGRQIVAFGNPELVTYWRSTAKPFQAMAVILSGAADAFNLSAKELAIACGSHIGSTEHIKVVREMLAKAGLTESYLQCGIHEPYDSEERNRLIREGLKPSRLHSNCSGKHAAMLLTAKHLGTPLETYRQPNHPVQQIIAQVLIAATGELNLPETVVADGCGAPIWASSLRSIALALHKFVTQNLPELDTFLYLKLPTSEAAKRLVEAMAQHPEMVSGKGMWNTRLIEATNGCFIGKSGAEGLFAGSFRDGRAIALKVQDGNPRATPIAVLTFLERLSWLSEKGLEALSDFHKPTIKNLLGEEIGFIKVVFP